MNTREESALAIKSGEELERFTLGTFKIRGMEYEVLTGWECFEDTCWWCGESIIQGKKTAHYCRNRSHGDFKSCFRQYWNHFRWDSAANWARKRADYKCENCERKGNLEVHHVVPLKGEKRFFTGFNLPWNLIVLCHECHLIIHAIIREQTKSNAIDIFKLATIRGQGVFEICK